MRILYFSRDYGSVTTTFIRNEVEYFSGKYECMYLCQRSYVKHAQPGFLKVVPFSENQINRLMRKANLGFDFYSPGYSREIKRIVAEFGPDIIHCHFAAEAFMLLDNIDQKKYPTVIHFHGYDASQALRNPLYVRKLKHLAGQPNIFLISCNEFFAERLSVKLQVDKKCFFVLPYGVDTDLFRRRSPAIRRDTKIFVQISSLVPKKGHEYTLKAFALFLKQTKRKDCMLVIAGDGPLGRSLEKMTATLKIKNHVQFKGAITPKEAARLLENADVFVHHSVTARNGDMEGTPNSVIEAMAMGLPVISTIHSGIPELVEDGVNGFLVNERNVEDYAAKMKESLDMGLLNHSRLKVEQKFNQAMHNEALEGVYSGFLLRQQK